MAVKIRKHDDGKQRHQSREVNVDLDFMGDITGYGETSDHAAAHTVMDLVYLQKDITEAIKKYRP